VPTDSAIPDKKAATTQAGNLTLCKMPKTEHAALYTQFVAGHALVAEPLGFGAGLDPPPLILGGRSGSMTGSSSRCQANSVVPCANVIVVGDDGQILLIRRTDNGNYSLPGGALDLGESIADTAIRETEEETGIQCEITGLVVSTPTLITSSSTPATVKYGRSSRSFSPPGQLGAHPPRAVSHPRLSGFPRARSVSCRCTPRWASGSATT